MAKRKLTLEMQKQIDERREIALRRKQQKQAAASGTLFSSKGHLAVATSLDTPDIFL